MKYHFPHPPTPPKKNQNSAKAAHRKTIQVLRKKFRDILWEAPREIMRFPQQPWCGCKCLEDLVNAKRSAHCLFAQKGGKTAVLSCLKKCLWKLCTPSAWSKLEEPCVHLISNHNHSVGRTCLLFINTFDLLTKALLMSLPLQNRTLKNYTFL